MFTNEFEWDATVTTILDESGQNEDVQVLIEDHACFIRQYNEPFDRYDVISLTHEMFAEFLAAMRSKEGAFKIIFQKK